MNSSGSAIAENEKWLDSIEGKTYQFTNALQTMWSNMLDSEAIKSFLDFGTEAIQFLDTGAGKVIALVAALKLAAKFKGFSIGGIVKGLGDTIQNITKAQQTLQALSSVSPVTGALPTESINAYAAAVAGLTAKQQANLLASQNLTKQDIQRVLQTNQCTEAEQREALAHVHTSTTKDQEAAASQALFVAKTQEMAATYRNNAATLQGAAADEAQAAATILETAASKNASKADLLEMVSQSKLTAATKQQIIAELGLAGAKKAGEAANYGLVASIQALYASNPVGWILGIISAVISVVAILGTLEDANEKVIESAQKAGDAINSLNDDFKSNAKTVTDCAERFAELAQGVDMLTGKNLSLTTDDYAEFLNLSNQLADIFPTLSRNYDENGNAIVQLSGDTDTIVESLYDLLEVQRQITNQKIAENLPDLYKGIYTKSESYNDVLSDLESRRDAFIQQLEYIHGEDFVNNLNSALDNSGLLQVTGIDDIHVLDKIESDYLKLLDELDLSYEYLSNEMDDKGNVIGFNYRITDFVNGTMSEEEIAEVKSKIASGIDEIAATYTTEIGNLNTQIQITANENKANWGSLLSGIATWLSTDSSYQVLNDEMKAVVQQMVNNIDFSSLDGIDTWEGMQQYIQTNIISRLQSATPEVQKAFAQLFKIDADDTTTKEYIKSIEEQAKKIAESSDFTYEEVLKNTGYGDIIEQYKTSAADILKSLKDNIPDLSFNYKEGLAANFHAFEDYMANVGELQNKIYSLSPDELAKSIDLIKKYGIKTWDELEKALKNKTFDIVLEYDVEQEGIEQFLASINESISATGLSSESIANLKARYQDLEGYNPASLFEETTNGIHLNAQALRELEHEYEEHNKEALDNKLDGLVEKYNDLTAEIEGCSDAYKRATLYSQRQNVIDQINDTAALAAQYDGLTSAYNRWKNAQSGGNERDMYEGILSGREEMDKEMSRGWIDEGTKKYLELLSGKDLSASNYEGILEVYNELNDAVNSSGYNVYDFFTTDEDGNSTTDGIFNFFDAVKVAQEEMGENWVRINEEGQYIFDFGEGGDKAIAEALGISEELVQIILRAAQDAGFEVNLDSIYSQLADFRDEVDVVNDRLKELGATDYTFNITSTDLDDLNDQIDEAEAALKNLRNEDNTLKVGVSEEDYKNAQTLLATLIYQKQTLDDSVILKVNVENPDEGIETVVQKLQKFKSAYNELEVKAAIGADTTEAKKNVEEAIASLNGEDKEILANLGIDLTKSNEEINAAINEITVEDLTVKCGLDKTLIDEYADSEKTTTGKVVWENNIDAVTAWMEQDHIVPGTVEWDDDTSKLTTYYTGRGVIYWNEAEVDGTAHLSGTAHAGGSWGASKTETALVGELGPEMLVRNGRWTTVGENGAEFTQIKKGDIIFNHKQTEELLSKGYVTGRGKAYSGGTALSIGNGPGRSHTQNAHTQNAHERERPNSQQNSSSAVSDSAKELCDAFDWIEIRIEEFGDSLDLLSAQLENAVGYSAQNEIIDDMIQTNQALYNDLIAGANEYYAYAEGLLAQVPEEYREAAQNGAIAIEDIVGENNQEAFDAIQAYREWAQKGDEATQQAEETLAEISALAKQAFDNIVNAFENMTSLNESANDQYEAQNEYLEASTGYASEDVYQAMIDENNNTIATLQEQKETMQDELDAAVEAGLIQVGSDDWYDAVNAIAAVDTEILNLQTDNEELQDSINALHWEKFDNLMNKINAVNTEANILLDILSNEDMVDDSGNWTNEGLTALGLHAQNMENAEYQAQMLGEQIEYLDQNWQALGYTEEEYLSQREDLLSQQQDAINTYYDEQDAIMDLNRERVDAIKEGIDKEIEAYGELIDKKKEALDAEKDLYDFQKSIAEQEKDIAEIDRQLAALEGDNSAAARAERARLEAERAAAQAELDDMYYQRSHEDQQTALDNEYDNFVEGKEDEKEYWDEYLENTNQAVADSLATVQANTEAVYNTLQTMGEEYSLSLSDALTSPWQEGANAIQAFSEQFGVTASATIDELNNIVSEFEASMQTVAQAGSNAVSTVEQNMNSYGAAEYQEPASPPEPEEPEEPEITVGGKIDATGAKIYSFAGDTNGQRQYFASDPIYTVLQEKDGYLMVRHHRHSSGVTGWFKKADVKAYAKGTKSLQKSGIVNIDELGEELVVKAHNGKLTYLEKGSGIVPADLTSNLMEWGKLDPSIMLDQNRPKVGLHPEISNTQISIDNSIAELIHIDNCSTETLPDVEKIINKALEKHTQKLNQSLRKYTR